MDKEEHRSLRVSGGYTKLGKMNKTDTGWAGHLRVFSLLLLACFSVATLAHEPGISDSTQPVLRIAVGRPPPAEQMQFGGYLQPVLRELFERSGIHYELVATPPGRVLDEANAANLDAAIAPVRDVGSRFPGLVTLPEPIMPIEFAGLYTRDDIELSSAEDFLDYRLAYLRGLRPAQRLFGKHDNVEQARKLSVLMSMLMHDRVDVVFHATYLGRYMAGELGLENLKVSEFHVMVQVYLHLSKRHASLLPVLETQLAAMKADGSLDSILAEHGVRQSR